MSADAAVRAIRTCRLVAILRASRPDRLTEAARVLVEEDLPALELPLTGPEVLDAITRTVEAVGHRAMVGAGTVRTTEDARRAIDAGATFLVSPGVSVPVIQYAAAHAVAILPGTFTPTEIDTALQAGAPLVKLFPAAALDPGFVRQVRVPLPSAGIVPTGGVELSDAPQWLSAGAAAVGVGSPLTGDTLETGDLTELRERARAWKAAVS